MEIAKKTKEHVIFKKKSGRFAVQNAAGVFLKAQEKVDVLLAAKLIKLTPAKKKEEPAPAAAEAPAAEAAPAATETPSS
jgi:hypothetical protein